MFQFSDDGGDVLTSLAFCSGMMCGWSSNVFTAAQHTTDQVLMFLDDVWMIVWFFLDDLGMVCGCFFDDVPVGQEKDPPN